MHVAGGFPDNHDDRHAVTVRQAGSALVSGGRRLWDGCGFCSWL
jgi:hypothetical protein